MAVSLVLLAGVTTNGKGQYQPPPYELPPILYSSRKPDDDVSRLLQRISLGEVRFSGSDTDILRTLLRELKVPVASQIVVFSKTSMQSGLVSPENPRALYFSDSIYVGWIPGGLIEITAIDPELGPIYYAFDPQDARLQRRTFVRETSCLRCHGGSSHREIPALIARSVITTSDGEILPGQGFRFTDDGTPFEQRWGGWFVTGYTGALPHLGNSFATQDEDFKPTRKRPSSLSEFFDTSHYLTDTSDVGALLVFQHQLVMHNVLTRASHRSRRAPEDLEAIAENVVDHLLFRYAAPLPEGLRIDENFRREFTAYTPRAGNGGSLKDFSGQGRLFANRCSFLIGSEAFLALPPPLKEKIYHLLATALDEHAPDTRYAHLEAAERRSILAILNETHPEARKAFARFIR
ncbi:MAG: hypothetical protein QM627_12045 [Luteolibacter sp.]